MKINHFILKRGNNTMDLLNIVSGICSIMGLIISIVSLFLVSSLKIQINESKQSNIVKKGKDTITQINNIKD